MRFRRRGKRLALGAVGGRARVAGAVCTGEGGEAEEEVRLNGGGRRGGGNGSVELGDWQGAT